MRTRSEVEALGKTVKEIRENLHPLVTRMPSACTLRGIGCPLQQFLDVQGVFSTLNRLGVNNYAALRAFAHWNDEQILEVKRKNDNLVQERRAK